MYEDLSWAPKRAVFVRRTLVLGAATFLVFMALALGVTQSARQYLMVSLLMPFVLTVIFFIDDFLRWRHIREERWQISEGHLIHDGPDGRAAIALSEIAAVERRLGGAVLVRLHSNQRILLRYLPYPAETAEQINSARGPAIPQSRSGNT